MIVNATSSKRITLGRLGENETRIVRFNIGDIKADFPGAEFMVLNRRPTESAAYPVSLNYIAESKNHLDWTIQSGDLLYQGLGECQLIATVDDKIAKSQIYLTEVLKALDGSGNPPAPWAGWVQGVKDDADRAEAAAAAAASAAVHGPEIIDGEWYVWDEEEGDYIGTGISAEGEPGQPGHTPELTASKSGKTTTIYADGTQLAQIQDGQDGQGADVIDDTAPAADKTYSSSKVEAELTPVKNAIQEITEEHISKNLYDKATCNPVDGKSYWEGSRVNAPTYATSGKISVEASTQYIFSAGSAPVKYVEFYSGETGGTFISKTNVDGAAFTTPEGCTYISVMLFAVSHTTDQYNAALAVAQLNKGATVQPYEPYGDYVTIPLDAVEDGDKLKGISSATAIQSQINLYDKLLAIDSALVYENQINTGSSFAKYAFTGFIPVKPNTQYCLSRDPSTPIPFITKVWEYNASRSYVGYIQNELVPYNANYSITFVTGATTYFIAVNMELASHTTQNFNDTIDSLMLVYGTQRPLAYSAYSEETVVIAQSMSNAFFANADCFKGKKWLALGTSVTWYDSHKYQSGLHTGEICRGYVGNVARRKQLTVKNGGIAGSTLGNVDADSLINRYQNIDWTDFDIVTIEYGINDYGSDIPVGTASDAAGTTTFAACLKTVIDYAMSQNKKLNIVICTDPDVRGDTQNNNNNTLKDYVDVAIAIAEQYRLPVCDWYYHSGINNYTRGNASYDWLTADGTHPNNEGHMRMGAMLNQVFDNLYC